MVAAVDGLFCYFWHKERLKSLFVQVEKNGYLCEIDAQYTGISVAFHCTHTHRGCVKLQCFFINLSVGNRCTI